MADNEAQFIDIAELRIGHYIYLDLGWMDHPFALNSFRISSREQIETLRGLGLERVRYAPALSDPALVSPGGAAPDRQGAVAPSPTTHGAVDGAAPATATESTTAAGNSGKNTTAGANDAVADPRQQRRDQLSAQRSALQYCEQRFSDATRAYRQVVDTVSSQPAAARERCQAMIADLVGRLGENRESSIRLLSEKAGERTSLHAINVTVISLLLGRTLGVNDDMLEDLGMGALLHDLGKMALPDRLRLAEESLSGSERDAYCEHVTHGVALADKLGLSDPARLIIAQHHELADGSGYPLHLTNEQISEPARIVSLVNRYDNLCNPGNPALAVTPHEALSLIYAQNRKLFDVRVLATFIRMMGVYPPGSVVELTNGHHALVVSVNSSRPLRPQIIVHDANIPPSEALILDLENFPDMGIRRSLKPLQLPKAAYDYLSPRKRLCYFFERARDETPEGDAK